MELKKRKLELELAATHKQLVLTAAPVPQPTSAVAAVPTAVTAATAVPVDPSQLINQIQPVYKPPSVPIQVTVSVCSKY